jgi:hypothetical protein
MFKFIYCRFKIHPKVDKFYEQWFLLLDTKEAFDSFIDKRANSLVRAYFTVKEKCDKNDPWKYADGSHLCDEDQSLIVNRLALDETRKTVVDDCRILDTMLEGYSSCFRAWGRIVVSANNSFRDMDESFEIKNTIVKKEIAFPATSEKDIKVSQWPNGHHWYVTVGNHVLSEKFITYENGLMAGKRHLNK